MEIVEFGDYLFVKAKAEFPSRSSITLNGVIYVVAEWRLSADEKTHYHLFVTQAEWNRRYGQ